MPSSSSSAAPAQNAYWNPTRVAIQQVDTLTITAAAAGGVVTALVGVYPNQGSISYTMTGTDTTTTAAAALQALLSASADGRFQEITFTSATNVITATSGVAGTPFTLAASASGGAAMTHAVTTPNASPNDAGDAANWNRGGQQQLPQNGDAVVVQDSSVGVWWNLDALKGVQFGSYTRWQSMGGTLGLPEINANGYVEYRPTYFQFSGPPGGVLQMLLGQGTGSGPGRERYNVGGQNTAFTVVATGSALDDYAVRLLGSNAFNVLNLYSSSVGVAVLPTETATLASATVLPGATLALGAGCSLTGTLTVSGGAALLMDAPNAVLVQQAGQVVVTSTGGLTYPSVQANSGATVTWMSDGNVTSLDLKTGSVFDKSLDARPITVASAALDGDSCVIRDPWSAISYTNPVTVRNAVSAGPFQEGPNRTWRIV